MNEMKNFDAKVSKGPCIRIYAFLGRMKKYTYVLGRTDQNRAFRLNKNHILPILEFTVSIFFGLFLFPFFSRGFLFFCRIQLVCVFLIRYMIVHFWKEWIYIRFRRARPKKCFPWEWKTYLIFFREIIVTCGLVALTTISA